MELQSLNVGCGSDLWGDVRVDCCTSFITMRFRPTVFADAEHLPFKGGSFKVVKASHVLEHLRNPAKALDEILRVATKELILSFPTEWDVLPLFLAPDLLSWKWAYTTRKNKLHLWVIRPEAVTRYLQKNGWESNYKKTYSYSVFHFLEGGRKAKYFRWLTNNSRIPFEYFVTATRRA